MKPSNTPHKCSTGRTLVPAAMCLVALILVASVVHTSTPPKATEEKPPQTPETPKIAVVKTFRLTLHPAPEPRPALKYLLLPPQHELESGNAAVHYQLLIATLPLKDEQEKARMDAALHKPVAELTRQALADDWPALWVERLIGRAARQRNCDWQLAPQEGIDMVVPSLGELRRSAQWLAVYARVLLSEGRYEEALHMLQAGNAMGSHVGQDLTLIQGLVGLAIHEHIANRVEEWVQQPGSPNLYWALTNLPRPLIHFPRVVTWEGRSLELTVPENVRSKLRTHILLEEQAQAWLKKFVDATNKIYDPEDKIQVNIEDFSQAPAWVGERLQEYGYAPELVGRMPPAQLHLLYTIDRARELVEDQTKWYGVPWLQGRDGRSAAAKAVADKELSNPLLDAWLGDLTRGPLLIARFDRKIAVLRVVEAIRMYAAEHDGGLPNTLDNITAVPVPDDPMTGKPFVYELHGETAILDASRGDDELQLRYELTIAP